MNFSFFAAISRRKIIEWLLAIIIAGVAFIVTLWLIVLFYLPYYTRHGKEVEVPYVIGLRSDEAARIIQQNKLRYVFLGRGEYVIKTIPESGTIVKMGRKVKLTLGSRVELK